jgi:hypothetical protein
MTKADRYALPGEGPTDEDLEFEVELTRRELSATVAELAHKANVKARVEEATRRNADRARTLVTQHRQAFLMAGGGAAVALTALIVVLIRRS